MIEEWIFVFNTLHSNVFFGSIETVWIGSVAVENCYKSMDSIQIDQIDLIDFDPRIQFLNQKKFIIP